MKRLLFLFALALFLAAFGGLAQAETVFFEDFEASTLKYPQWRGEGFTGTSGDWNINSAGYSPVYGKSSTSSYNDFLKGLGYGQYMNMRGGQVGSYVHTTTISNAEGLSLAAGTYTLSYIMAGYDISSSSVPTERTLNASVYSGSTLLASFADTVMSTTKITSADVLEASHTFTLVDSVANVFLHFMVANHDVLLDNINLDFVAAAATPIPASALLLVPGLLGVGLARRRLAA